MLWAGVSTSLFDESILLKGQSTVKSVKVFESIFNPIWTGLFANLKRLGGAFAPPPPNLAISSQKTMKLGKGILWVEIFTN